MTGCWEKQDFDGPASVYDVISEFYDDDMGVTNPGTDIAFFTSQALGASGPVLELGCGTGRISLRLVQAGCRVVGLDASPRMLEVLRRKADMVLDPQERARLEVHCADMSGFELGALFPLVICPFSAFNYLVEDSAQLSALACISRHLKPEGRFVMDTFLPDHDVLLRSDDYVYLDYRRTRADGTVLQREKRIRKNPSKQINVVERTYTVIGPDGSLLRTAVTRERIRYLYPADLQNLLESAGFTLVETLLTRSTLSIVSKATRT
jgi:SAM-dependent methyltransferase